MWTHIRFTPVWNIIRESTSRKASKRNLKPYALKCKVSISIINEYCEHGAYTWGVTKELSLQLRVIRYNKILLCILQACDFHMIKNVKRVIGTVRVINGIIYLLRL